jgi:tRNA(His) 5'-end guanylyltransferase
MKFDELDNKMRVYETANDAFVLPNIYMVARIDGRNFTRLTKETHNFEAPFDIIFRDYMVECVKHAMNTGFNIVYGYTQSDEISLLFHINETSFSRKHRKYNSILAAEISAKFSLLLGSVAAFDCRICELPNRSLVTDYFRWRNEDAHRNSLSAHCYWLLRKNDFSATAAARKIEGLSTAHKNELLLSYNVNFNELPSWQKRGIGFYWKEVEKEGFNPKLEQTVMVKRRELQVEYELPMKDHYNEFIMNIIAQSEDQG